MCFYVTYVDVDVFWHSALDPDVNVHVLVSRGRSCLAQALLLRRCSVSACFTFPGNNMVKNREREKQVKQLAALAKRCGLEGVGRQAKKEDVLKLGKAIQDSRASVDLKAEAQTATLAYQATFQGGSSSSTAQPSQSAEVGFRLRGKSFLFTYNWDYLHKALPDGTVISPSPQNLWHNWCTFVKEAEKALGVLLSTYTMETSVHSDHAERYHIHWAVDLETAIDHTSTLAFAFHGIRPDGRSTFQDAAADMSRQSTKKAKKVAATYFKSLRKICKEVKDNGGKASKG